MKKLFSMFLAVTFALSTVGVVFAADNAAKAAAPAAAPAAKKKASPAGGKKASKAKSQLVAGTLVELDAAAGTFTLMVKRRDVSLKAGKEVKLAGFKVGDKVTVKYSGWHRKLREGREAEVGEVREESQGSPCSSGSPRSGGSPCGAGRAEVTGFIG